jgi:hypothetical protein
MALQQETKGQMLLDCKARCTLPKYNVSVVPTKIFLPPFGQHEKEIRHFADISRLRELSGRQSPFAPYLFIRDNDTAMGTGENESKVLRAGESTSKIIETMEAVQDASKGAQGVVLNPFAGQLLWDEGNRKEYAPIFGWIAYTREATARGNAVLEWTLGHPKGAVQPDDNAKLKTKVHYNAFCPATMRRELGALDHYSTPDPYVLVDEVIGAERAVGLKMTVPRIFDGYTHPARFPDKAFSSLFPALLRLGGEPLYFEGATLFLNRAWQHIILQVATMKEQVAGLATKDMAWLSKEAGNIVNYPSVKGEVSGDIKMLMRLYADALENPGVICAGFDVSGKGSREFSTLHYSPEKLKDLNGITDPNAMLAYSDQHQHITGIISRIQEWKFFFGGIWSFNDMHTNTFRGHTHGYFSRKNILGFCHAAEKKANAVSQQAMNMRFQQMLPQEFRGNGNLKITGRFRMEADDTLPFAKVVVEEITGVARIKENWED